jgi:hypothetical protein
VANFAYQVTGAFQGNGQFAFQGLAGAQATQDTGTFNLRPKRRKRRKIKEIEYLEEKEYSEPQEAIPENIEALAKALAERGIPINKILLDYELEFDEEDALIQATKILIQ